ncbi:LacI family DNA-binding transcriptional regulator [Bacillus sp. AFS041924]|uniref:LacI family DNA-binding transcriptional regulator n=1 Tax=Bacillus sp. AFS041924 TaxID=2033503 RepID=UPI000BFB43C8|nr:LacI family DNA-binding transcriptional regulator [Bacillus sp. AFS041924]PGS55909.1 LacI family transcriptional regulator [Bacillus sp. AFS041924]
MGPTIYDIARVANVSKSTVSRVLNNKDNISEESRIRVMKAIEELNYQPNKLARALTSSGFDAILVMSRSTKTTAGNTFFSEIIHSISTRSEVENFDVIIQTSKNSKDELNKCIEKIRGKMIKGILMLSSPANEDFFKELDKYKIPVVVIGRVEGNYQHIYSVDTDNFNDSYQLVQHLINQGHTDIACLHSSLDYHVSIDRLEGYKKCLIDNGIPLRPDRIIDSGYTMERAYEVSESLLKSKDLPTAIFAIDDLKVIGLYNTTAKLGISIPKDVSVIGYNNGIFSPLFSPPLTGIEIPVMKLGEIATDLLFKRIKNVPKKSEHIIVPTKLVERKSVAKLN